MKRQKYKQKLTKHYKQKYIELTIIVALMIGAAVIGYTSNNYCDELYLEEMYKDAPTGQISKNLAIVELTSEEPEIEVKVREIARKHGFKWEDWLIRLAMCESSMNHNAINDNGYYGKDRGLFQINDYFHPEVSDEVAFNVELATEWVMWRVENGYQEEWMCNDLI